MKLVIQTQFAENYGAHDWDGEGACPQRWKFKGGDVYVVPNLSPAQVDKVIEVGIPTLRSLIEFSNQAAREYILDYSVQDDADVVCEPWETPFELYWEQGRWVARRTVENGEYGYMRQDIGSKTEQYTMMMEGGREDYSVEYRDRDGKIIVLEALTPA
jgi:hypothetical protein